MNLRALLIATFFLGLTANLLFGQNPDKKQLDHLEFDTWNWISNTQISKDGRWVVYEQAPGKGDGVLMVFDAISNKTQAFPRGGKAKLSEDGSFLVFSIAPFQDSLNAKRRLKIKKEKLPKDSLGIVELATGKITKIPQVKSFQLPEKWNGWVTYQVEPTSQDSITAQTFFVPGKKKASAKNGSTLIFKNLETGKEWAAGFVLSYAASKNGQRFVYQSTGDDTTAQAGIYLFDTKSNMPISVFQSKGTYKKISINDKGDQVAFVADLDTTNAQIRPLKLFHWQEGWTSAVEILKPGDSFLPTAWMVSEFANLNFSDDGTRLFFGIAPPPIVEDTTLLEEEIVQVEVWKYDDPLIYPQQKVLMDRMKKQSYLSVYHIAGKKLVQLGNEALPYVNIDEKGIASFALGYYDEPYLLASSWEGGPACKDVYSVDVMTGKQQLIAQKICGTPQMSPSSKYFYWFSYPDSMWFTYNLANKQIKPLADPKDFVFYDETNDAPTYPNPYGVAGWLENDSHILVYDRFDIWKITPGSSEKPINLTQGRKNKIVSRYIDLDREERFINPSERILLHQVNEDSKDEGYAWLEVKTARLNRVISEGFSYSTRPIKAKAAEKYVFTKENFHHFPDLLYGSNLAEPLKISDANPQQSDYSWGSIELYEWTSLDGQKLRGMLVKPEGFDPSKKYPMIVNFYEVSSNTVNRYRGPEPNRSQITYAFYASRGYLVFNPDIIYKIGYPGESAYNAVVSGVTSLIDEGFVDKERIGIQGHSWGGYQIAFILTKTNLFRCAESGAPVVNMFSAYGGIRWETGLSRMFQYEHTQSRIGGSIWEYPLRFMENSPLFTIDKIQTPVLILHNDSDGAVPWYQGIEFITAMRRLNKPAWMLNYNGEPHWPLKRQNRMDFQLRMSQFFDYYLKDAPMPQWMERGVPPLEKGIIQGYKLMEKE